MIKGKRLRDIADLPLDLLARRWAGRFHSGGNGGISGIFKFYFGACGSLPGGWTFSILSRQLERSITRCLASFPYLINDRPRMAITVE